MEVQKQNLEDVYLTDDASPGIKLFLNLLISHHMHGITAPIPQYPLYLAAISQFGELKLIII